MRHVAVFIAVISLFIVSEVNAQVPSPARFLPYLLKNRWESGLPLSYYVRPYYFESIPPNQRPDFFTQPQIVPQCNGVLVPAANLNAYEFQTEELLTAAGLNLYDGSIWQMATALLGQIGVAETYQNTTLLLHKTLQFTNIKADRSCRGVINWGQCTDTTEDGSCGFCYGDTPDKSLPESEAYFFRMISDVWSFDGTRDARCPILNGAQNTWKWNDYRPVTGENSWANLIGPLQVAYLKAGYNVNLIPDSSTAFTLAFHLIPAFEKMLVVSHGAVYYAPRNTWDSNNPEIGSAVSTENNASLYAGLKMLLYILQTRSSRTYDGWIGRVSQLLGHVKNYLRSSYNAQYGYFSQGGSYDPRTNTWTWVKEPFFAVDCQTWVIAVLGQEEIDAWYGAGTTANIWSKTKLIGGYKYNPTTKWADGVGFSNNTIEQVFSGEWSVGALNMLRVLAAESVDPDFQKSITEEANYMRQKLEDELVTTGTLKDGSQATGVLYSNKRYFIPFGWYANPLWSTASIGWLAAYDLQFNPFYLGGEYKS